MTVTPEQIEGASFSTVKRGGYRTEEVDRFLRTLAEEVRSLAARVRSAEGANEDLQAASAEMATLMRDVHAQLGEKRRVAEAEVEGMLQGAERDAASIISTATAQADTMRAKSDRVLNDAEQHAALLRSDGEQRVREAAEETLRAARAELQELLRRKHEILHALAALRGDLTAMESRLDSAALTPDAINDEIVNRTLIDLREAQRDALATAADPITVPEPAAAPETPAPAPPTAADPAPAEMPAAPPVAPPPSPGGELGHPAAGDGAAAHPASSGTFFSPPEKEA
ncbi:MAG: DivIVA domain-containing protein [Actinomycetota bacterium]